MDVVDVLAAVSAHYHPRFTITPTCRIYWSRVIKFRDGSRPPWGATGDFLDKVSPNYGVLHGSRRTETHLSAQILVFIH